MLFADGKRRSDCEPMLISTSVRAAIVWLLCGAAVAGAQDRARQPREGLEHQAISSQAASEDIEPRVIGTPGTTIVGFSGYVDRFSSSERGLPTNYAAQIDVGRFVVRQIVVRGGLAGTGSLGGDDSEERATGSGAPALHAFAGALYFFTPQSMLSLFAGGEYWAQLTQRAAADAGSIVGMAGMQGALSSRASVFIEGGYGIGLTRGDEGETVSRFLGRIGVRLKL